MTILMQMVCSAKLSSAVRAGRLSYVHWHLEILFRFLPSFY